ncbi:MAG TPA: hypothetical protein VHV47_14815 [Opitutaceae bacterium]|jgi:hypothetical protein|nr:hypothetical protein [Opitutaceae bacterium]
MKATLLTLALLALAVPALADDVFDTIDDALTFSADHDAIRVRLSGTVDLEAYAFKQPAPAFIVSSGTDLFQPRFSNFLDAQLGPYFYAFAQTRLDRDFDPTNEDLKFRLDEYALRLTPGQNGAFNLQLGQFASVVGNWNPRHLSWDNPFVNAPLPYEYLTGVWDVEVAKTSAILALWDNTGAKPSTRFPIKTRSLSILWGPSYATGASVSGTLGQFDYAAELKNASLSSRPQDWSIVDRGFQHPTLSTRLAYRPDASWNFGLDASEGPYLLNDTPASEFPRGYGLGDYREIVYGVDAAWLWRNWETWAELYDARFQDPTVGNLDSVAYYVEARYKFTEKFFLSGRWNQERFNALPNGAAAPLYWAPDVWRIDVGPTLRFTAHTQLKLEYSFQREDTIIGQTNRIWAAEFTLRY